MSAPKSGKFFAHKFVDTQRWGPTSKFHLPERITPRRVVALCGREWSRIIGDDFAVRSSVPAGQRCQQCQRLGELFGGDAP